MTLQASDGHIETRWIEPETIGNFTVPEGDYRASLDAPEAPSITPLGGEVAVKDFHHYEAAFHIGAGGDSTPFYIGD